MSLDSLETFPLDPGETHRTRVSIASQQFPKAGDFLSVQSHGRIHRALQKDLPIASI